MNTDTNKNEGSGHKEIKIIINGRERTVAEKEMSFDEIVTLAFGTPPDYEQNVYTVTYFRQEGKEKKEGSLVRGQSVHVKDGMVFTVVRTTRS